MAGQFGDATLQGHNNPQPANDQEALSQNVLGMAVTDAQKAAPAGKWDKFVDTTEEGVKDTWAGVKHALSNPWGLVESAAISVGMGVAGKILLPETGPLGTLAGVGLTLYFGEQTAVPIYKAYKTGMNAKTMGDIHNAGGQLGDALGGLAVNLPIGIVGYKVGARIGDGIMASPRMAGFVDWKAEKLTPINDAMSSGIQAGKDSIVSLWGKGKTGLTNFLHDESTGPASSAEAGITKPDVLKGSVEATDKPLGLDVRHMDTSVDPGKDFYKFSNGKWEENMQIPSDQNSWGTFNEMEERANASVHGILQDAARDTTAAPGSNVQKIGDFYASGMDEAAIEAAGAKPLAPSLAKIDSISSLSDLTKVVADMHGSGNDAMFDLTGATNPGDSTQMIATVGQGGLSMARDYWVGDDAHSAELRAGLGTHIEKMFGLLGDDADTAKAQASQVMNVESRLAKVTLADEDIREPSSVYHKMPVADLQKLTPNFDWTTYLKGRNLENVTEVNVTTPDFFKGQNDLLTDIPLSDWKAYLRFHQVKAAAPFLSSDFVNENFNFFGKALKGAESPQPRWEQVVDATSDHLPEAVGEKYVEKNFSPEAKAKVFDYVEKIKDSMRDAIKVADLADETRAAALEKIDKMGVKIGYPDKFKDYSALPVDRESYFDNVMRAKQFAVKDNISSIGQPVDRSVWGMSPETVNAQYDPSMNDITIPAAILQPPYFDLAADDAVNLGNIGATIGHEITHAFDDQGAKYDANGNLRNWWTQKDFDNFMKTIQKIRNQYSKFTIPSGEHVKGDNVSGEAAADLGGANISFNALQKILGDAPRVPDADGFTPEERFFIAFGQSFATKYRPEALETQVASNEHPPDPFRVNGTVGNMGSFERAFKLPDTAPIMVPPDERAHLWESDKPSS